MGGDWNGVGDVTIDMRLLGKHDLSKVIDWTKVKIHINVITISVTMHWDISKISNAH